MLDEGRVRGADLPQRSQHGNGRTKTAHGNFLLVTDVIKARRIELQDFFDREIVLVHSC